jgi:hypothetical protein
MRHARTAASLSLAVLLLASAGPAAGQEELTYREYDAIAQTARNLLHCAMFEPLGGEVGMHLVIADRYGKLNVFRLNGGEAHERVWVSRQLDGNAEEVLAADLDGDGLDDHLVARTTRRLYAFDLESDYYLAYESQPNDFQAIRAFTVADVDDDPALEIVVNADQKIHYVDGDSFSREWTSLNNYEATRLRCGDVDGDGRAELVLNTGQVLDASTGDVEWEEEAFGARLELLDFDADGILEVLTEGDGTPLRVWDIDYRNEKRFQ